MYAESILSEPNLATDNPQMRNKARTIETNGCNYRRPLNVILNHRVKTVNTARVDGEKCVLTVQKISSSDFSGAETEEIDVYADAVIITVPIGILKAGSIEFHPPLSSSKLEAIKRIGAGNAVKVVMEFETAFWPLESELLNIADYEFCTDYDSDASILQHRGVLTHFWNYHHVCGGKRNILIGFALGDGADILDRMNDEQVKELIKSRISTLYGKRRHKRDNIALDTVDDVSSLLIRWKRTRWGVDPNSLCAYSYLPVGEIETKICDELARRENDYLYFAGEACHTSSELRACVHGAW